MSIEESSSKGSDVLPNPRRSFWGPLLIFFHANDYANEYFHKTQALPYLAT